MACFVWAGLILVVAYGCHSRICGFAWTLNIRQRRWLLGKSPSSAVDPEGLDCRKASPDAAGPRFPRLGKPVPCMKPEYDVVVVGSGYGGGVAASRMARAGKSVAILELGTERWPGEYPSSLKDVTRDFHVTGETTSGSSLTSKWTSGRKTGMYHLIQGEGQDVFVGNGLGGTSLINANVCLRAEHRTLQLEEWPAEIRQDPSSLDQYYARAERMLQPMPYPFNYQHLKKLEVFNEQAHALGKANDFYIVPQTTFFHNGPNNAGVQMNASTCSGQDCTGINDGSKNSVLMNYLPDAWNHGAEIFCECELRYIQKDPSGDGNGYVVYYAWHGNGRAHFKDDFHEQLMWVRAKEICFLGAGAIGTTEILLRSQARGMGMSSLVGQKMSGNGDMLSFGYNSNRIINGVGSEEPPALNPCGPTVTSIIDSRGSDASPNVRDGYVLQEGAIPAALAPVIQGLLEAHANSLPSWPMKRLLSRVKGFLFGSYSAGCSVNRTQSYLVMSHDNREGSISLQNDRPHLAFSGVERVGKIGRIQAVLQRATSAIGGSLINAPSISVHPLGGARMSSDGTGRHGVVNHLGQVFTGLGAEVHEGLVCCDGSILPTSLGVNPFATITALAERACDQLAISRQWTFNETPNGRLDLFGAPAKSFPLLDEKHDMDYRRLHDQSDGASFTEIMDGFIYIGSNIDDFETANKVARGSNSSARLFTSIEIPSVEALQNEPNYAAIASGTLSCYALSKDTLLILHGGVRFFTAEENHADCVKVSYTLSLLSASGDHYLLHGYKSIDSGIAFSLTKVWKATTTLYTTITRPDGSVVGRGILHISTSNFIRELCTLRSMKQGSYRPVLHFITFFLSHTLPYFLAPFRPARYPPSDSDHGPAPIPPKSGPSDTISLTAKDGTITNLKRWDPPPERAKHDIPILLIPGASVDDTVFTLPTIPTNTIDYFTSRGYRCYVHTLRFGKTPAARLGHTVYEARWDVHASLEYVRSVDTETDGRKKQVYVICHCLGSIATSMALLTGAVPSSWIAGMTCSQVFFNLHFSPDNSWKARHPILLKAYRLLLGDWYPTSPPYTDPSSPSPPPALNLIQPISNNPWPRALPKPKLINLLKPIIPTILSTYLQTTLHALLDTLLKFYPIGPAHEYCTNSTCHRSNLIFGRCFTHGNLNRATHDRMHDWFGGAHMRFLEHLMALGRGGEGGVWMGREGLDAGQGKEEGTGDGMEGIGYGEEKDTDTATKDIGQYNDNNNGDDSDTTFTDLLATPGNLSRLQGLPILFLHGSANAVFDPLSTARSLEICRDAFGERDECGRERFQRIVVQGYGHLDTWMGWCSARDVFPWVEGHVRGVRGDRGGGGGRVRGEEEDGDGFVKVERDGECESHTLSL
ncbi:FAD/NAD(P)-binding domain-containing protein [Lophiostoma macrostomum CBS 122681]|uniref:Cholesterol oxidase n=1 Tax=Lophiostoma macrostomum CBS 122681 TaxID=1314788 RepID=A0A6A6TA93_9PLEO|nr:FAD/NAD(P)-binding domain-containing protein [Lophiostoma macrostomum CBS 122681]